MNKTSDVTLDRQRAVSAWIGSFRDHRTHSYPQQITKLPSIFLHNLHRSYCLRTGNYKSVVQHSAIASAKSGWRFEMFTTGR